MLEQRIFVQPRRLLYTLICVHVDLLVVCYLATCNNFLGRMAIGNTSHNRIPLKPIGNTDNKLVTIQRQSSIRTLMLLRLWIVTNTCCLAIILFVVCYLATYSNFLECMAIGNTSYNGIPLKPIGNTDNKHVTIHRQNSFRTIMLLRLWNVTYNMCSETTAVKLQQ